jgi:hypothetical protein
MAIFNMVLYKGNLRENLKEIIYKDENEKPNIGHCGIRTAN